MDRNKWMYKIGHSEEAYMKGVLSFLEIAKANWVKNGDLEIWCPCKDCKIFDKFSDIGVIENHLITRGFVLNYTRWSRHGELQVNSRKRIRVSNENDNNDSYNNNDSYDNNESYESSGSEINESFEKLKQMFRNMEGTNDDNVQEKLQKLFDDSIKPLYNGCTKFSILNAVVKLFNLKAKHGWSDVSFTELLEALHEMFPDDNKFPISLYQAKKMMNPMGLEIEIIHACPNDCMLYRGVYADLHKCVTCGES
ncbi:ribonuclease H-like domain-containing protein, partial [Tanacetum coccineum]